LTPPSTQGLARIDVRQLESRPPLTIVTREGDPQPAVAVAVATGLEPVATLALATLVEHRLSAAGQRVELSVDRTAFRIAFAVSEQPAIERFLTALSRACTRAVGADDGPALERAGARVRSLQHRPLEGPALEPIADCADRLTLSAEDARKALRRAAVSAKRVEEWRVRGLAAERMAIAVVGTEAAGQATLTALERTATWPHGPAASAPWPTRDRHGVYASRSVPAGTDRLHIALRLADSQRAVSAVEQLRPVPSPLSAKLATLPRPWRLQELSAAARPGGGCIEAVLHASVDADLVATKRARTAARAAAVVRTEIARLLERPADPYKVAGQALTAGDARAAAARAAWWSISLSSKSELPLRVASALGVAAEDDAADPAALDELRQGYERAATARAVPSAAQPIAERRLAVEQGQGELWLLLGSPCVLAHEGAVDAGISALAVAVASASAPPEPDVMVEPWIAPDGVGLVAHAALQGLDDTPAELARRVGRAAGRVLAAGTTAPAGFVRAQQSLLRLLEQGPNAHFQKLAVVAVPNHPSWLAPFGLADRVASLNAQTSSRHWRRLLRSPLRLAVIANVDAEQARLAAEELDRWLLPEARGAACRETAQAEGPEAGVHRIRPAVDQPGRLLLGVLMPQSREADAQMARLLAAALDGPDGLLARELAVDGLARSWSARVVGGRRRLAVLVETTAAPGDLAALQDRLLKLLETLRKTGRAHRALAVRAAQRRWHERMAQPRARLVTLWLDGRTDAPISWPTAATWQPWLASALDPANIVLVVDQLPDEP